MDRKNKRIFIVVLLLVIGLLGLTYISDALQYKVVYEHSWTIEESKENGYFLTEYKPLIRKIKLTHHSDSVEFFRLWTERKNKKEKVWLFYRTVLSDNTHFQIDYKGYPSETFSKFQIEGYGGHGGQGTIQTDFISDTVTFQIVEKKPVDTLDWREQLTGQKIKFVRVE